MKARKQSRCAFCIGLNIKDPTIKVGEEIVPHPSAKGLWVHAHHIGKPDPRQISMFGNEWLREWEDTKEQNVT